MRDARGRTSALMRHGGRLRHLEGAGQSGENGVSTVKEGRAPTTHHYDTRSKSVNTTLTILHCRTYTNVNITKPIIRRRKKFATTKYLKLDAHEMFFRPSDDNTRRRQQYNQSEHYNRQEKKGAEHTTHHFNCLYTIKNT